LSTLADLQEANGKSAEAAKTMSLALADASATPTEIHMYARRLQRDQKNEEALKVFEINAKRFPDQWPVHMGLARGHFALGHLDKALAEARLAEKQAPDEPNKKSVAALIQQIQEKKAKP
jgi:Flp pilus assembly protein TadD